MEAVVEFESNKEYVVEWEKELKAKGNSLHFRIWKYYKQQLPIAIKLGLQEHLWEMCMCVSHSALLGSKCRKGPKY